MPVIETKLEDEQRDHDWQQVGERQQPNHGVDQHQQDVKHGSNYPHDNVSK